MARVLVVTGTDTEVGKTVVVAALAARARAAGERVAVVKAAQTGLAPGEPGDADEVRRLSGVDDVHEVARYAAPLAPATAARLEGRPGVTAADVAAVVAPLADRDLVLVEGAGGILVRLHADGTTLADVAALLDAPVLVVARAGLGTLNHAALTVEALRARGLTCPGIVVGSWPADPTDVDRSNLVDLPDYAGPVLGAVAARASALEPAAFQRSAASWITTEGTSPA